MFAQHGWRPINRQKNTRKNIARSPASCRFATIRTRAVALLDIIILREAQRLAASRQSARGLSPLGNKHKNTRKRINSLRVISCLFKLLVASRDYSHSQSLMCEILFFISFLYIFVLKICIFCSCYFSFLSIAVPF